MLNILLTYTTDCFWTWPHKLYLNCGNQRAVCQTPTWAFNVHIIRIERVTDTQVGDCLVEVVGVTLAALPETILDEEVSLVRSFLVQLQHRHLLGCRVARTSVWRHWHINTVSYKLWFDFQTPVYALWWKIDPEIASEVFYEHPWTTCSVTKFYLRMKLWIESARL